MTVILDDSASHHDFTTNMDPVPVAQSSGISASTKQDSPSKGQPPREVRFADKSVRVAPFHSSDPMPPQPHPHPHEANLSLFARQPPAETIVTSRPLSAQEATRSLFENHFKQSSATRNEEGGRWNEDEHDVYLLIRHRLDLLEYPEYLPQEALPLVQRLVSDLIQSTDSARQLKMQVENMKHDKLTTDEQVKPLRHEISRLTEENNHLHQDMIKLADERDAKERRTQEITRRLTAQVSDLRFMLSQYSHRVQEEEKRADETRNKVEDVMGRFGLITASGLRANKSVGQVDHKDAELMFQKLQKIDIETGLEPLESNPVYFSAPDPVIADMLHLSESKFETLSKEKQDLESKNTDLLSEIQLIRDQLGKREREIQRLSTQLEIARSQQFNIPQRYDDNGEQPSVKGTSRTAGIYDMEAAKDRIEQLEIQIEFLQEHIEGLEKEVAQAETEKETIHASFIDERDRMAADLESERARTGELIKNLSKLEAMVNELSTLRAIPSPTHDKPPSGATAKPSTQNGPIAKYQKQVSELKEKLKQAELKTETTNKRLQTLQKQYQRATAEVEKLKKQKTSSVESKKVSTELSIDNIASREEDPTRVTYVPENGDALHDLESRSKSLNAKLAASEKQLEEMKAKYESSEQLSRELMWNQESILAELNDSQRERDQLLAALERFEQQMKGLHNSVEAVTADRDNLATMHEQVNAELQQLRIQFEERVRSSSQQHDQGLVRGVSDTIPPDSTSTVSLRDAEEAKARVKTLEREVENLQQDLKATVTKQKQTSSSADVALQQLEAEIDSWKNRFQIEEAAKMRLSGEVSSLQLQLTDAESARLQASKQLEEVNLHLTQMEMDRERDKFTIRELKSKVSDSERLLQTHTDSVESLQKQLHFREEQLAKQKQLVADMDKERDKFQEELDAKAEIIVDLKQHLQQLQVEEGDLSSEVSSLKAQLDDLARHLNERDREVNSVQRQLEDAVIERDHYYQDSQRLMEQAHFLGVDLSALTRENQILSGELAEATSARDQFQEDLGEAERQISILNQSLSDKEAERDQLMTSYRQLISEHERLDLAFKSMNEDGNNSRMEVVMRDKRIQQLQKELDDTSAVMSQYKVDLNAFEKQSSNLTRSLATAERTIRHLEGEKGRLLREMNAARDLTHSLDRSKDDMQRQLSSLSVENEKLSHAIMKLETERDALTSQLKSEKLKADRLEHLVAVERTRKMQTEKSVMEMQSSESQKQGHLERLNQEQSLSIVSLTQQLEASREEIQALQSRINSLEDLLRNRQSRVTELEEHKTRLESKLTGLQEDLETKEHVIQDMLELRQQATTAMSTPSKGSSAMEEMILRELQSTKKQLKRYERQIASKRRQSGQPGMGKEEESFASNVTSTSDDGDSSVFGANASSSQNVPVVPSGEEEGSISSDDAVTEELLVRLGKKVGRVTTPIQEFTTKGKEPAQESLEQEFGENEQLLAAISKMQ